MGCVLISELKGVANISVSCTYHGLHHHCISDIHHTSSSQMLNCPPPRCESASKHKSNSLIVHLLSLTISSFFWCLTNHIAASHSWHFSFRHTYGMLFHNPHEEGLTRWVGCNGEMRNKLVIMLFFPIFSQHIFTTSIQAT